MKQILLRVMLAGIAPFAGSALVQASLVAEWNFNEIIGGATLADQVGSINGTINTAGGSTEVETVVSGAGVSGATGFLNAYNIKSSSTSTHINLGTTASTGAISNFGTGAFSVAGWFDANQAANSHNNDRWIIGNIGANSGFVVYLRRATDATNRGKLYVSVGGGSNQITYISPTRLDLNSDAMQWHWFALTSDGSAMTIWLDGIQLATVDYLAGTSATPDVGTTAMIGRAFNGQIDQLTVWNHELTGTVDGGNELIGGELFNLWQQGTNVPESGVTGLALSGLAAATILYAKRAKRRKTK